MGRSDKPDIDYRFFDHVKYMEGFIEKMELNNITLVLHDWGSGIGFN
jgi:haloalkane dehalogenase